MSESTSPDYYQFPNGAEVIDVTQWLTGCGAQAVQYVARATRTDGKVKGDPLGDLRKAKVFIDYQIEQWEQHGTPVEDDPGQVVSILRDARIEPDFSIDPDPSRVSLDDLEDWLDGKTDLFEPANLDDLGLKAMRVYRLGSMERE